MRARRNADVFANFFELAVGVAVIGFFPERPAD
jgi:hypothetical protein